MRFGAVSLLASVLLAAAPPAKPSPSPAMPTPLPAGYNAGLKYGVWTLHMKELDFNYKSGDFSTPVKVYVTREGGDITADRMSGNQKKSFITFYGNVIVHDTQGGFSAIAGGSPSPSSGPSTLTADQLDVDGKAKIYTATGHVHYVHADTVTDADKGVLNDTTHTLYLDGNVHLTQGQRNMTADHVIYDTITGNAHAESNVIMEFPSELNPHFATPRPLKVPKIPFQRNESSPGASASPSPAPSPSPTST
jgi:lipopolysaccharide export system protein LptA